MRGPWPFIFRVSALLVLSALAAMSVASARAAQTERPTVGAIRWDAWFKDSTWQKYLAPKEWQYRLPFFAKSRPDGRVEVRDDNQRTIDQEIAYAEASGLDYWAFDWYHPKTKAGDRYNHALRLYLSSKRRSKLRFCLLLCPPILKAEWPKTCDTYVSYFKDSRYMTVAGGRPLLYIFVHRRLDAKYGSWDAAKEAFDLLRGKCRRAGLPEPYIVGEVFNPKDAALYVDKLGFGAISAYTAHVLWHRKVEELPYRALAASNLAYWNACKATGKQVVPLVNTGWDYRPLLADPKTTGRAPGVWFAQPSPAELAANLQAAMDWVRDNRPHADANTILIYAWNESAEGGWLVPTKSEGAARLEALGRVLRPTSSAVK